MYEIGKRFIGREKPYLLGGTKGSSELSKQQEQIKALGLFTPVFKPIAPVFSRPPAFYPQRHLNGLFLIYDSSKTIA
jgi:hypothetical protein